MITYSTRMKRKAILTGLTVCCAVCSAAEETRTTPGELRTHATNYCIGIEWDITGDKNHNAVCQVQFRPRGETAWRRALDLFRTDYYGWWKSRKSLAKRPYNMFAGSILFLRPGAEYEVELSMADPDGGAGKQKFTIRTRPWPTMPKDGKTHHVRAATEIAQAQESAQPGDTILLHKGAYGVVGINKSGKPGRYIVWKAAEEGVVFEQIAVSASHVWIDGLNFVRPPKTSPGLRGSGEARDVVLSRNTFKGYPYSIALNRACRDWHIMDNTMSGDRIPGEEPPEGRGLYSGEGIELAHSEGHTVCYNSITHVADGISYSDRNCDIFGNDIFDVTDDGIEPDYCYSNVRMWGNRLTNSGNYHFSFQPMFCGPWYIIRNLAVGRGDPFKFNGPVDRFLLANNTLLCLSGIRKPQILLNAISRNNLFIKGDGDRPLWDARPWSGKSIGKYMPPNNFQTTWRTDADYDGLDWGQVGKRGAIFWEKTAYPDLASFGKAIGIEQHGLRVFREKIFEKYDPVPKHLTLKEGCAAIDAGAVLPNINEDFLGKAPDLGAYEFGRPLPHYGPRTPEQVEATRKYWLLAK